MFLGWTEILLIGGLIAAVMFTGPGRISGMMKDFAGGIRAFRDGIKSDPAPEAPPAPAAAPPALPQPAAQTTSPHTASVTTPQS